MSLNYNHCTLAGHITAKPELKMTQSGISVTTFTVAVNRPTEKDVEQVTDFIPVVAWRKTAEFVCRYFEKGSAVFVTGSIQVRKYKDKNNANRYATEIIADKIDFVESKGSAAAEPSEAPASNNDIVPVPDPKNGNLEDVSGDDLPF